MTYKIYTFQYEEKHIGYCDYQIYLRNEWSGRIILDIFKTELAKF